MNARYQDNTTANTTPQPIDWDTVAPGREPSHHADVHVPFLNGLAGGFLITLAVGVPVLALGATLATALAVGCITGRDIRE